MGTQTWVCVTIVFTEVLICLKFDWETITKPFPDDIALYWKIFLTGFVAWTLWQFYIWPLFNHKKDKESKDKKKE